MDELKTLWAEIPPADRQTLDPARRRLLDGMRAGPPRRGRPAFRFAVAGGLAAALTATFVVVQIGADPAPASAQDVLALAAEAAAAEPDLAPRPGQVVHSIGRDRFSATESEPREDWVPADWSTREFIMRQGEQVTLHKLCGDSFDRTMGTTYADMARWPTDLPALRERVRQAVAEHPAEPDKREIYTLTKLLDRAAVRPSLRAGLFQLVSEVKGVRLLPKATDALDRTGVGVATPDGAVLVFEPETYRYLGFNVLDAKGELVSGHAVQKVEVLDKLPMELVNFRDPNCIPA
ncbi:CU044_5270 family protein [Nonomuraea sp. NPDC050310]|uniref:CU044_5270 family protein n=1 Tax=Nonomuraea sp. NPDC050310 TaxID=3154935 RepID=UPI0033D7822A